MTYAIFVAAFVYQVTPVLLLASALNGLLGNVLWTAHGMMLTSITTDENKVRHFPANFHRFDRFELDLRGHT